MQWRPLLPDGARGSAVSVTVQCPFVSLVALIALRVLLLRAKHLFVAAIGGSSTRHWEAGQQAQPQAQGRGLVGGVAGRQCRLPCPPFSASS